MSLETALRFEADRVVNPNLRKAYEDQVERIKYDEKMADRENVVRLYKFNDFWDTLVADVDHIVKKAAGEDETDTEEKRMDLFDVEKNINQRAAWNENLEEASWKKRIKNEAKISRDHNVRDKNGCSSFHIFKFIQKIAAFQQKTRICSLKQAAVTRFLLKSDEIFTDSSFHNREKNINQRAAWNENLEEASWKKRIKNEAEIIKSEIRMAAKAALSVRRVALKQLLEKEFELYEKELSLQGKTFYKQRI